MSGYRVILIHGTFARNAEWIKPSSSFCTWLKEALPNVYLDKPFEWSGWNSHKARWRAALKLRAFLAQTNVDGKKTVLVCHSHGGTVALLALADTETRKKVSRVICLATPFLSFERRNLSFLTWFATISILATIWTIPVLGTLMFSNDMVVAFGSWASASIPIILGGLTTCGAFVVMSRILHDWISDMLEKRSQKAHNYIPHIFVDPGIIIVHSNLDEARMLLATSAAASNSPYTFCVTLFAVTFVAQLIAGMVASSDWLQQAHNIVQAAMMVSFGAFIGLVLSGIQFMILSPLLLLPTFLRSHPAALGFEGLFINVLFKVKTTSCPIGFTNISSIMCRKKASWVWGGGIQFNHSMVYQSEEVVRDVVEALAEDSRQPECQAASK